MLPLLPLLLSPALAGDLTVGEPAPTFTLPDLDGTSWSLEAQRGKVVVLEWFNPGCPFVVAAHEDGPLRAMASSQPEDVVWVAINSNAPGTQGADPAENRAAADRWSMSHPILLDPEGTVGKRYGATNTPQMVVIDAEGVVRYHGALDNAPRNKPASGERIDYTADALAAVRAGRAPQPERTKAWGCSVKYR